MYCWTVNPSRQNNWQLFLFELSVLHPFLWYCVSMTMGKSGYLTFITHLHQHPLSMSSDKNDNDMYFRTPCTKCTPTVETWRMVSVIDTRKLKWFTSVSSRRKIPTPMVHTKVKLDQLHGNAISSCFRYYKPQPRESSPDQPWNRCSWGQTSHRKLSWSPQQTLLAT